MIGLRFRLNEEQNDSILGWKVIEILDRYLDRTIDRLSIKNIDGEDVKVTIYEYALICKVLLSTGKYSIITIDEFELLEEVGNGFYYLDGRSQ